MSIRTRSTQTEDVRTNPFRDPTFKPKMNSFPTPEFRRKVERVIDQYVSTESASAETDTGSVTQHLPTGGHPGDILQLDSEAQPQWLRKLTISEDAPNDSEGENGDIWIET